MKENQTKKYNYISILTGGKCKFNCDFCVGKKIRIDKEPHISNYWKDFIENNHNKTKEISISGSTSDPYFLGIDKLNEILNYSKTKKLYTSLHSRSLDFSLLNLKNLDELVLSVDKIDFEIRTAINCLNKKFNVRLSVVITSKNKEQFTKEYFDRVDVTRWTLRKNIFEKIDIDLPYPVIDNIFKADVYGDNRKQIALWDFKKQNNNIKALYLWQNDMIKEQCYWKNFNLF